MQASMAKLAGPGGRNESLWAGVVRELINLWYLWVVLAVIGAGMLLALTVYVRSERQEMDRRRRLFISSCGATTASGKSDDRQKAD